MAARPISNDPDASDVLDNRERSRVRHRDRKRTTRMVVDNAAVKRIVQAVLHRHDDRSDGGRKA